MHFARKMSQITHFCGVKLLAWKSGCVKFWTNIMSAGNLLALKVLLEDHWPMIWDLGQNYDEKSNWQKYDNAVVRCRIFLLCGELEMRILWDSRCHALVCKMPREIINCPLYPIGLEDTTESLYFFLLLCITICNGACFQPSKNVKMKWEWLD